MTYNEVLRIQEYQDRDSDETSKIVRIRPGVPEVILSGGLARLVGDRISRYIAAETINRENGDKPSVRYCIHMGNVPKIDTTGVGTLGILHRGHVKNLGSSLSLSGVGTEILQFLVIPSLDKMFEIYPDEDSFLEKRGRVIFS
jgi:anti-anti-sigma regulatory factor